MNKSIVGSLVAVMLLAIGVVFAATNALGGRGGYEASSAAGETASGQVAGQPKPAVASGGDAMGEVAPGQEAGDTSQGGSAPGQEASASISGRPDCPAGTVAGIDLPCLGGNKTGQAQRIEIVNVWAWWCGPCRTEMPLLAAVAQRHPEWTLVGVHADPAASNGAAFLNDTGVSMPSYQDDNNTFAGTLGLPGVIPITLVIKDDNVVGTIIKPMTSEEEIETEIGRYLS